MGVEKDDIKFEQLLNEKRHKELINSLTIIVSELKKEKKDGAVIAAIEKQSQAINKFVEVIRAIPVPATPEVNVEVNQAEIVSSIERMGKLILQELRDLKTILGIEIKPSEWEFKVNRNSAGYIESVKASIKSNQIKAQA